MELDHLAKCNVSDEDPSKGSLSFLVDNGIIQMAINLLPFFQHLVVKCGHLGVVVVMRVPSSSKWSQERSNVLGRYIVAPERPGGDLTVLMHFPPQDLPEESIVNVTGAGDTLVAAILTGLISSPTAFEDPKALSRLIAGAQFAATMTLRSVHAVSPELSSETLSISLP
jgi:pseudouridylate synthase / pseudouridine kinase